MATMLGVELRGRCGEAAGFVEEGEDCCVLLSDGVGDATLPRPRNPDASMRRAASSTALRMAVELDTLLWAITDATSLLVTWLIKYSRSRLRTICQKGRRGEQQGEVTTATGLGRRWRGTFLIRRAMTGYSLSSARTLRRCSTLMSQYMAARTVAVRGWSVRSAISPKN